MPPGCWKMRCCKDFFIAASQDSRPIRPARRAHDRIVAKDAALVHRYQLLISMPGVGPLLACTLIALLPELGGVSRKQIAALVGIAPYAFDSGTLKGRRCIW